MRKKALLLTFLFVGLMSITFAVPAAAQCTNKPNFLLESSDVPNWGLFNESCISMSYPPYDFEMWWQIWIYPANATSWIDVTKALVLMTMEFPIDLNKEIYPGMTIWGALEEAFSGFGFESVSGTGLDHCIIWNESNIWFAIGNKKSVFVMAGGWNSEFGPSDFLSKTPVKVDADAATKADTVNLMIAQGSEFGGIPAFTFVPIVLSITIVLGIIFMLRKDQLKYVKTF